MLYFLIISSCPDKQETIIQSALWIIDVNYTDTTNTGRNHSQPVREIAEYIKSGIVDKLIKPRNRNREGDNRK